MKTQISRDSFRSDKRYSGLYQQQGRMLVDADWNELMDIVKHRLDDALHQVVNSGAPLSGGVFDFSSDPPLIRWGTIYADGIRGELQPDESEDSPEAFDFTQQYDFPGAAAIAPSGDYRLYADVWERPVISLEDEDLRDPGLHGADTCTRTRTMAQIKWCPLSIDPEADTDLNPGKGNAGLDLTLRITGTGDGDGDPCGSEVTSIDPVTGNYLFRLEVHHVSGAAGNPDTIELKWSTENGAEQHWVRVDGELVDTVPVEFKTGDWIYEFYSDTSEAHLGVHLNTPAVDGFPVRFDLKVDGYPAVVPADAQYIRRWDGYCRLIRDDGWTVEGKDGVVDLTLVSPSTADAIATHGDVKFESGQVKIFLNNMVLALDLDEKQFVAGDYWQAVVRDNTEENDQVQLVSRLPLGIDHHYVTIARFEGDTMVAPESAAVRKMSFPALSDLTADKVGYDPTGVQTRWEDIHDDPALSMPLTVQAAIDDLVQNLESSDISYPLPACGAPLSVRNLLPAIKDLADATRLKINAMIDALLCELGAATLPCDDRGVDMPVQDALDNRVHKDGDTMTGKLTIQNDLAVTQHVGIDTSSPSAKLHVFGSEGTSLKTHGLMVLGDTGSQNISMDNNEIMARNSTVAANLNLNAQGGHVIINGVGAGSLNVGTESDFEARVNVNGTVKMSGFKMTTSPRNNYVLTSDANGVGRWKPSAAASWILTENGDLLADLNIVKGNVGIGTERPNALLHLSKQNVGDRHLLKIGNQNQPSREWSLDVDGAARMSINNEGAGKPFEALRINSDGAVGIGIENTVPNRIIDVNGHVSMKGGKYPNAGIWLKNASNVEEWFVGKSNEAGTNKIGFWSNKWLMVVQQDGNVGIGTTSPGKDMLDVRGRCYSSGGWQTTNADYAEYFETDTGKAIPVGTSVTVTEEGRIKEAKDGDAIIGIVTSHSAVVGNSYKEWPKKYLRDEFGQLIVEKVREELQVPKKKGTKKKRQKTTKHTITEEVVSQKVFLEKGKYVLKEVKEKIIRTVERPLFKEVDLYDAKGKKKIGMHKVPLMETYEEEEDVLDETGMPILEGSGEFITIEKPKLNPDYDSTRTYVQRSDRPEWCCVGLLGQLPLRKGNPVASGWVKMKDLSDKAELWLVK